MVVGVLETGAKERKVFYRLPRVSRGVYPRKRYGGRLVALKDGDVFPLRWSWQQAPQFPCIVGNNK